jgi:hypothetical protein
MGLSPRCVLAQPSTEPTAVSAAPSYALSWVRAEGAEACPAASVLAAEVERRLGRAVFDAKAERSIEVDVMRFGERYRSDVYVRDAAGHALGHRQLESDEPGCGALLSATALAVALVIDPEAASREPAPAPAAASFEPPPAAPIPAPPPAAPVPVREIKSTQYGGRLRQEIDEALARRVISDVALGVTYNLGLVPHSVAGAALEISARPGRDWGFALTADYVPSQTVTRGIGSLDVGLTRASALLTYDVAYRPSSERLWLGIGPTFGAFHVGVRAPSPVTDSGDFIFAAAEARASLQVCIFRSFFVRVGLAAVVAPFRQEFLVRKQTEPVWRQPVVAGSGFFGLGMSFP